MEGRENVISDARPSRPGTSTTDENIEVVKEMILDNRRITIREIADDVGISFVSSQTIFTDSSCLKHKFDSEVCSKIFKF